ncbi:hypothetical protein [Marinomonas mediterranea]|jgi:hypothetical protein|uniref:Uncharacterized protein n=1 Tax=Marinomonas mediterranea (strain ATCC 700492 / JCM 21426 / NBRC 103028 / MMB-1) TaxID=717774 RepID=F2K4A1_MARM1|nr:hypothetical protein [Marinomonas mediterranea]ADZ92542.1 hypothetical protein Marme_3326 [Marinomonas mediterranea MMB-1]WCN10487.1 hypothetical protein GV055_16950 [Marinomonas mediterranea]WCN18587.1 hypothetical protein GV053_16840 [Marinomonas mediterranea MMB-1]
MSKRLVKKETVTITRTEEISVLEEEGKVADWKRGMVALIVQLLKRFSIWKGNDDG